MRSSLLRRLVVVSVLLVAPAVGYAQEATVTGTVTDATGPCCPASRSPPCTTRRATPSWRSPTRVARIGCRCASAAIRDHGGARRASATVTRTRRRAARRADGGRQPADVPVGVAETVTVTGEAPLIETQHLRASGGNIDPQQVEELPRQGRNWMALALLAPGSRHQRAGRRCPSQTAATSREFQLNVDGQQVTSNLGTGNQPRYSHDSIAEFQFISNRFDATQGRSIGRAGERDHQVGHQQAVGHRSSATSATAASTPTIRCCHRVLPYSNQQSAAPSAARS